MKKLVAFQGAVLVAAALSAASAEAVTFTYGFTANAMGAIYNADNSDAYSPVNPVHLTLPTGTNDHFTLNGVTGSASFNSGGNSNDADGVGAAVASSSNTGTTTLSGITAPNAGYLVGVFLGTTSGAKPSDLTYVTTDFTDSHPLLQQVFFVGDGLTGDGTGSTQTFYVPTGATDLYLGFSDAAGYNGAPGAYGDNSGSFTGSVAFETTLAVPPGGEVPEPTGIALLGLGALAACLARRRR